ncbi:MAG: ABC transporter substrate-binding protein [Alphaproteobacteria bacterium]|nr:ABC transporter substrate-binding protein [Alphaproteobacteria bacterium]
MKKTSIAVMAALAAAALPGAAQAQKVNLLLDWGWLPYHTVFLMAEDKGYYKDAGLEVKIEQGRGSATTAVVVGQGSFDIGHINVTNAAQAIAKGVPLKVVAVYQHRSSASFIGMKDKVQLKGPQSLKGIKIGSTPGGSDGLSLAIFTKMNNMPKDALNIVGLDGAAKRAALLNGTVDVVSGDSHAYAAIVRGQGKQPSLLLLADYGVPLLGFGFAANEGFLKREPQAVRKFLAATKRGFATAAADPKAACQFIQAKVLIPGSLEQCVDYFTGLLELSQSPKDANWGRQTDQEWEKLVATLKSVDEIKSDKKPGEYFTNEFVP